MSKPDRAHRRTDEKLAELEQRIAEEYKKAADELQEKVDTYFKSFAKRDAETKALIGSIVNGKEYTEQDYKQWRLTQIGRGKRFEALRDKLAERMTRANEVTAAYINNDLTKVYAMNRAYGISSAIKDSGGFLSGADFIMWDENTVKRLLVEQPDLMPYYPKERAVKRGIDLAYGKRKITEYTTQGILQGYSTKKIARNLMDSLEKMERVGAVRAARTAITAAYNGGRYDADAELVEKGAIIENEWICRFGPNSREEHKKAHGQRVPFGTPFSVGGEELRFPGDASLGASGWNLYNCQCYKLRHIVGNRYSLTDQEKIKYKIRRVK